MTKFSTITQIRTDLNIKNSQKTGGGRKIYAKISYFSIFLLINGQNVLYLVGNYDTYKGLTPDFDDGQVQDQYVGTMILIKD